MFYTIVAGVLAIFCIAVIIFAYRIIKENNKMVPKKDRRFEDDDDEIFSRP